jgi:hypothetical protein
VHLGPQRFSSCPPHPALASGPPSLSLREPGFTVFLERRILSRLHGEPMFEFHAAQVRRAAARHSNPSATQPQPPQALRADVASYTA